MDINKLLINYRKLYKYLVNNYDKTLSMSLCINYIKDIISTLESCRSYEYKKEYAYTVYNKLCEPNGEFLEAYDLYGDNLEKQVSMQETIREIGENLEDILFRV